MNDAMGFTRDDMAQEEREFFREHDKQVRADVIKEIRKGLGKTHEYQVETGNNTFKFQYYYADAVMSLLRSIEHNEK